MRSLIKFLVVFCLLAFDLSSWASFAPNTTGWVAAPGTTIPFAPGDTPESYCKKYFDILVPMAFTGKDGLICVNPAQPYANSGFGQIVPSSVLSCPANATNTAGSCDCNSGYSEQGSPVQCLARTTSPNGTTAPRNPSGPLGPAPYFGVGAIGGGILTGIALVSGVGTFPVLLMAAGSLASGVIAAPGWFGGSSSPVSAQQAADQSGFPIDIRLDPSIVGSGTTDGGLAGVNVNTNGRFVPGGGGTFTGNGATGGWNTGGATGEWTYTPAPISPTQPLPPVVAINDGGWTVAATTQQTSDGQPTGSVVIKRYDDGSTTVTEAHTVPVVTDAGVNTTANVQVTTSYDPGGTKIPGSTVATVGSVLGNGTPAAGNTVTGTPNPGGNGFAIVGPGSGYAGSSSGTGNTNGAPCGTAAKGPCLVSGEVTVKNPMKIDEGGMPSADSVTSGWKDILNKAFDDKNGMLSKVTSSDDKDTSWGVVPTWLSGGGCGAITLMTLPSSLGGIAVNFDMCPVLPLIYSLMNLIWVSVTFGAVVSMVQRVTGAGLH